MYFRIYYDARKCESKVKFELIMFLNIFVLLFLRQTLLDLVLIPLWTKGSFANQLPNPLRVPGVLLPRYATYCIELVTLDLMLITRGV